MDIRTKYSTSTIVFNVGSLTLKSSLRSYCAALPTKCFRVWDLKRELKRFDFTELCVDHLLLNLFTMTKYPIFRLDFKALIFQIEFVVASSCPLQQPI